MTRSTIRPGAIAALILLGSATPVLAGDDSTARSDRRAEMIERHDSDGDGKLSEDERKAAREAFRLERWDTDGDGKLSDAEREAGRARRDRKRAEILDKYDEDGNGRLSEAEREAARADGVGIRDR